MTGTITREGARAAALTECQTALVDGVAISGTELGQRYGRSPSWGRAVAAEARRAVARDPAPDAPGRSVAREAPAATVPAVEPAALGAPLVAPGGSLEAPDATGAVDPTVPDAPTAGTVTPTATAEAEGSGRAWYDTAITLVVAVVAAAASYGHMYEVALMAGEPLWIARAFPITVDGLVLAALRRGEQGRRWLVVGLVISVVANVLAQFPEHAEEAGPVVSAFPPLALYGIHRLLHGRPATR